MIACDTRDRPTPKPYDQIFLLHWSIPGPQLKSPQSIALGVQIEQGVCWAVSLERLKRRVAVAKGAQTTVAASKQPPESQAATQAKGQQRYEGFVEALGRRLQRGQSSLNEIPEDATPSLRLALMTTCREGGVAQDQFPRAMLRHTATPSCLWLIRPIRCFF